MDDDLRRRAADLQRAAGPDIYSAVEGLSAALTSTVKLLSRMVDQMERGEEELRDAHLDLANALNRRMDELHSRVNANAMWIDEFQRLNKRAAS